MFVNMDTDDSGTYSKYSYLYLLELIPTSTHLLFLLRSPLLVYLLRHALHRGVQEGHGPPPRGALCPEREDVTA